MTTEQKVADAFRLVAMRLEESLERGRRPNQITADDLLETLLSIADRLDPPVGGTEDPVLAAAKALLEAREDQMVTCVEWDRLEAAVAAASR